MKTKSILSTTLLLAIAAIAFAAETCSYCGGTGINPTDNLSASVPTFGNDLGEMYCKTCRKTVQKPHVHGPCTVCHGTGRTR